MQGVTDEEGISNVNKIIHSFILSSSKRRLTTMDFHSFLSSAILFTSPYALNPVHSVMSSIHILLGLPLGFFPHILPSKIYRCVSPLEPLITCPAYSSFLFFILLMKCKLVCIRCNTSTLVILSFQLIFNILL